MARAMLDMETVGKMIHATVPISRFNKGEAGRIIEEVKEDGIRVIVRNNAPECILLSVEEYGHLMSRVQVPVIVQTAEEEARRKAFIARIRQNVPPPIPASRDRKEVMDAIGPIDVDEEAINELRRISIL